MRCNKCGEEWTTNTNICPRCGNLVFVNAPSQNRPNNANYQQQKSQRQQQPQQARLNQQQMQNYNQRPARPVQQPNQNYQRNPYQQPAQNAQNIPVQPNQQRPVQSGRPAQYYQYAPTQPVQAQQRQNIQESKMQAKSTPNYQSHNPDNQKQYNQQAQASSATAVVDTEKERKNISSKLKIIIPIIAVFLVIVIVVSIIASLGGSDTVSTSGGYTDYYNSDTYMTSNGTNAGGDRDGKYTLMVYMIGSNLESERAFASSDLTEIISNDINLDNTNIIVYAGGAKNWKMRLSSSNKNYLKVVENDNGELEYQQLLKNESDENMCAPTALSSFLKYSYENYPADNYGLIFWDHGAGTLGFGYDEVNSLSEYDFLDVNEMEVAFEDSPFKGDNKLDWIGFDACLMATVEVGHVLKNHAKYMVASEDTEDGDGWDYSFISTLNDTSDPLEICKDIISKYESYYQNAQTGYLDKKVNATLSLVDLSKNDAVYNGLVKYLGAVEGQATEVTYTSSSGGGREIRSFENNMCDVVDVVDSTSSSTSSETQEVKNAVSDYVIENISTLDRCSGVTFYYEAPGSINANKSSNTFTASEYSQFYNRIGNALEKESKKNKVSWKLDKVKTSKDSNTLKLSEEQKFDLAYAYYNVLADSGDKKGEVYTPVMTNCEIAPDSNGNLKVPANPYLVAMITESDDSDSSNKIIFPVKMSTKSKSDTNYTSINAGVYKDRPFSTAGDYSGIVVNFRKDSNKKLQVTELKSRSNDKIVDRSSINENMWTSIGYYFQRFVPENTPYDEWANDGFSNYQYSYIGSETSFCNATTEDFREDFFAQIVLVDTQGKKHATGLFELNNFLDSGQVKAEVNTKNGKLSFVVYDDHAELYDYEGGDKEIKIPEKVKGVHVTSIGSYVFGNNYFQNNACEKIILPNSVKELGVGAFAYTSALKSINIPEDVTCISDSCFEGSGIKSLKIPKGVERIGKFAFRLSKIKSIDIAKTVKDIDKGIFYDCTEISEITINGMKKSRYFKIENDYMLLTKNGKELVCSANVPKNTTKITIPDSVEVIRDYGMANNIQEKFPFSGNLDDEKFVTKIEFPDGLRYIGDFAFRGCITLKEINLPDSVTYIGNDAFSSYLLQEGEKIESVRIGKNVAMICNQAFSAYKIKSFKVDKKNKFYKSVKGKLMNKGGDVEIPVFSKEYSYSDDGTYYDMKGKSYSSRSDVLYYDKKGNTYLNNDGVFTNTKTKKKLQGNVVLDKNGYIVSFDSNDENAPINARLNKDNEVLFEPYEVSWNSKGKLTKKDYLAKTYYDRKGKSYKSLDKVPYYTKDGKIYYAVVDEEGFIDKFEEKGSGNIVSLKESYITSDGYLYITKSSLIDYIKSDFDGNVYYNEYSVIWNKDGKMVDEYSEKELN